MSKRFDDCDPTALEQQADLETCQHFADQLKQFPVTREAVERLEQNMAMLALAANMGASRPTTKESIVTTDDGVAWHKSVALMDNIHLCHRHIAKEEEYAVVEYFPARGTNEIWNRGWNASDVLQMFTREQRRALQLWTEDMTAQVKEFLAEKYPGQDLRRVAASFIHRFTRAVSKQHINQTPGDGLVHARS